MSAKLPLLIAAAAAAVSLPALAAAQSYYGGDYGRGDYSSRGADFSGYPQFAGAKAHIRGEIRQGLSEGWLDRGDAYRLFGQLRWVQQREYREFRQHGWSLPAWDQQSIRASLDQIDRGVDQARDQNGYRNY